MERSKRLTFEFSGHEVVRWNEGLASTRTLAKQGEAMNEHKQLATKALEQMRGDDLHRARAAFRNCTQAQMGEQYGQSGKTRAEMLAGYEAHEAKVTAALSWLAAQG